ncbi:hypothetical protein F511_00882, partial [Dorcoceras hygrometricum]
SKQRKEEIMRLREELKLAEDGMHHDVFPENMMCKCYFFDDLGDISHKETTDGAGSDQKRFSDVLRRRFLRQVRLSERKRKRDDCSSERSYISDFSTENEMEQLRVSVDFLLELCENSFVAKVEEGNFKNWSHQAVDFILGTLKALSSKGNIDETVESIVSSLIVRLTRRMCDGSRGDESRHCHKNPQFYIQHLLRKLGTDPYIGQRVILSVSQRISLVAESLLFMDPFDRAFPKTHNCMYIITDHISRNKKIHRSRGILEHWVASIFNARQALELLEGRSALYMLYMDRVVGDLTRQLGRVSSVRKLQPDILAKLFG